MSDGKCVCGEINSRNCPVHQVKMQTGKMEGFQWIIYPREFNALVDAGIISCGYRINVDISEEKTAIEAKLKIAVEALEHIASRSPKCDGCLLSDISLFEHYNFIARQALESYRKFKGD